MIYLFEVYHFVVLVYSKLYDSYRKTTLVLFRTPLTLCYGN